MDHCVCIGANLVDIGALTNFRYLFQNRENIYGLLEACCGARLTVSYVRVGGLAIDVPDDFVPRCRKLLETIPKLLDDVEKLVNNNRIVRNRLAGHGGRHARAGHRLGPDRAVLRASGVAYDVRRARPYDFYDKFDWDVPIAQDGDNFARYLVRMEEMRQSLKIIRQALEILPAKGPVSSDDWHVVLPPKDAVYNDMESLIYHFKLVMEGIRVPAGRALRVDRGRKRRARLLRRLRRPRRAVPPEGPAAVLPDPRGLREDDRRRHGVRRRRDAGHPQRHRRESSTDERRHRRQPEVPGEADASPAALHPRDPPRDGRDDPPPPPKSREHEGDADDPVPRGPAELLGAFPRKAHPQDARGRHAEVRGLLHVPAGLSGGVHHDRRRRASRRSRTRSTRWSSTST